ncbi:hypothetical protein EYF80_020746 [Liparis tanakae]|uniref:Uncharacterized protein n=1 Tax=Liparis tanakae TaxID=230148 RepID=A0A4Z2HVQ0_9TELE|nr:hypothetical protein EYF80_020746 [Liparis tanakae]
MNVTHRQGAWDDGRRQALVGLEGTWRNSRYGVHDHIPPYSRWEEQKRNELTTQTQQLCNNGCIRHHSSPCGRLRDLGLSQTSSRSQRQAGGHQGLGSSSLLLLDQLLSLLLLGEGLKTHKHDQTHQ